MTRVKRIGLFVTLVALLFTVGAVAQTMPTSASYNEATNVLVIVFDSNVQTVQGSVVIGGMKLDDDNGGLGADYSLRGGSVVNTTSPGTTLKIRPIFGGVVDSYTYTDAEGNEDPRQCWGTDYADVQTIETSLDTSNLRLFVPQGAALDASGNPTASAWVNVTYRPTADAQKVNLTDVQYNANTNVMRFEFDTVMRFDQIAEDIATQDSINPAWPAPGNGVLDVARHEDRNGNGVLDMEEDVHLTNITFADAAGNRFSPASALDITRTDSTVLEMELSRVNQFAMEALDMSTLTVSFGRYTFMDLNYNDCQPVTDEPVTVVPEADPLLALSASYDMGENKFEVNFDQPLQTNVIEYILIPKFRVKNGPGADAEFIDLSSGQPGLANADSSVIVTLTVLDQETLEDFIAANSGSSLYVTTRANAVVDELGNGNREVTVPLEIIPETSRNKAPAIDTTFTPNYDAFSNTLTVKFDVRLDAGINVDGFYFTSGTDTLRLTGGVADRAEGNKAVAIQLSAEDQHALESDPNKDSMMLHVEPYSVLQQSKLNGNHAISTSFDYIADPNPPLVTYVWYDFGFHRMVLESNVTFSMDQVDLTKLTYGGVALTAPDSIKQDTPTRVSCYLNSSEVDAIEGLTDAQKVNVTVDVGAGLISSEDGLQNEAVTGMVDHDVVTNGVDEQTVIVGYGRNFYIRSFEGFPTATRTVDGSLRKISTGANWFMSNEEWVSYDKNQDHPSLNMTEIDSAVAYFEDSTPKDPSRGAREMILDVFAGTQADRVPEKVDFIFADVLDELVSGRADANSSLWQPGYVIADENTIILDSHPQGYISSHEAWVQNINPTSSYYEDWTHYAAGSEPSMAGRRAISNLYTEYVLKKIDPFETAWVDKGLAYLSEFVTYGPPQFYGYGPAKGFGGDNSMTFIGSDLKSRVDFVHVYMYFLYIWEKYGGADVIREIAESPRIDMEGIQLVLDDRKSRDLIPDWLASDVLGLYLNFAEANLIDTTYGSDHRLFAFTNITAQRAISGTSIKWKPTPAKDRPPYELDCPVWGFSYYFTGYGPFDPNPVLDPATDNMVLFAGSGATNIAFRKVNLRATTVASNLGEEYLNQDIELDPVTKSGSVPMNPGGDWNFGPNEGDFPTWVLIAVGGGGFKMTNDSAPADYSKLFISGNPALERRLDMYVISNKTVYNKAALEAPILWASSDEAGSDTLMMFNSTDNYEKVEFSNTSGDYIQYLSSNWMASGGTTYWHLDGYYVNGVRLPQSTPTAVTVTSLPAGEPGSISMGDDFNLRTTASALHNDQRVGVIRVEDEIPDGARIAAAAPLNGDRVSVSSVYKAYPLDLEFDDPASLTLKYDPETAAGQPVGVFLDRNGSWEYIGGNADPETGTISVRVNRLGSFRVLAANDLGDIPRDLLIPQKYALKQNYPNPFNPTTTIEMMLPHTGQAKLIVYDILGREVARLIDGQLRYGVHRVVWNGRSVTGAPLSSGVYFVRMSAAGFHDVKKMVLVK